MSKIESSSDRPGRIDWSKVSSGLEVNEITVALYRTFLIIIAKLKERADERRLEIGERSWDALGSMLVEAATDLVRSLDLNPYLFFSISFQMSWTNIGRAMTLQDGRTGILLNGDRLIDAALCFEQFRDDGGPETITSETLEPVLIMIDALAHELGHIHLMQLYPGRFPASTQSWDIDAEPPSDLELAKYAHDPLETHATSVSIRYLRRKQQVGAPIWGALAADSLAKENLENILVAGVILQRERVGKLQKMLERVNRNVFPELVQTTEASINSTLHKIVAVPEQVRMMRRRIRVLGWRD